MAAPRAALALALLVTLTAGWTAASRPMAAEEGWSTRVPPGALEVDAAPAGPTEVAVPALRMESAVPVFGGEVRASGTDRIGEPAVKVAGDGTVYVHAPGRLWRSTDGGASFQRVTVTGGFGPVACGCDADVAVDDLNNVMYTDLLYPNCVSVGMSPNRGDRWITNRLACNIDEGTGMDRQWLETSGKLHTYLTYRVGGVILLSVAPASPAPVFVSLGQVNSFSSNFRAGYLAVDRAADIAYLSYTSGQSVRVVVVEQGGLVMNDHLVAPTGGSNLDAFSAPAVDRAGNVYMVWNERAVVGGAQVTKSMFASSTDRGKTWSAPVRVDTTATSVFPWIVAGADGKVGIVYYGSADARLPGSVAGDWYVHYAYSANAHDASPTFTDVVAVPHVVRTGPICTQGTGCASGTRGFLDFFGVHMFPDGRAAIAYNDQTGLAANVAPYVNFIQQVDGPRLA